VRILVAAPVMPYPGISNAGGELLLRHLTILAESNDVTLLVAQEGLTGRYERVPDDLPFRVILVASGVVRRRLSCPLARIRHIVLPLRRFENFWDDVSLNEDAAAALRSAELVELHWFEMIATVRMLRKYASLPDVYGFYHDVLSQRLKREVRAESAWPKRTLRRIRYGLTAREERDAARLISKHLCLSKKDEGLVRAFTPRGAAIYVLDPPLDEPEMRWSQSSLDLRPGVALMVADFGRVENEESALWLLEEVWPLVHAGDSGWKLMLAGGNMTGRLHNRVVATKNVTVTGYVRSLASVYIQARVAVSPALRGAGVKFKSLVPMLWGIPVVATEVGAEGIDRSLFIEVTDDPMIFAAAIRRVLMNPSTFDEFRTQAMKATRDRYTLAAYRESLVGIYVGS
jgi:glycosyltransferase involved in cell wall biosynthesis